VPASTAAHARSVGARGRRRLAPTTPAPAAMLPWWPSRRTESATGGVFSHALAAASYALPCSQSCPPRGESRCHHKLRKSGSLTGTSAGRPGLDSGRRFCKREVPARVVGLPFLERLARRRYVPRAVGSHRRRPTAEVACPHDAGWLCISRWVRVGGDGAAPDGGT
jgi:hypothetical protein